MSLTDIAHEEALAAVADGEHSRRQAARKPRPSHVLRRIISMFFSLALLVAAWALFAPPALGGKISLVVTDGISMLPHFHGGDVVLLYKESSYHVGEVAGYHNGQLGVVVMHRIVAINDGHYAFKGDNNNFVDSYEPTKSQIVGAEWLHLAGAGRYMLDLRDPFVAAIALGMLSLYSFSPRSKTRRQRRRHRHAR